MSFEAIASLAHSFDQELKEFESHFNSPLSNKKSIVSGIHQHYNPDSLPSELVEDESDSFAMGLSPLSTGSALRSSSERKAMGEEYDYFSGNSPSSSINRNHNSISMFESPPLSPVPVEKVPLEHSFELAAAEWEREQLHDKLSDLMARVEELDSHNRYQETVIQALQKEVSKKKYVSTRDTGDQSRGPTTSRSSDMDKSGDFSVDQVANQQQLHNRPDEVGNFSVTIGREIERGPANNAEISSDSIKNKNSIDLADNAKLRLKCHSLEIQLGEANIFLQQAQRALDDLKTVFVQVQSDRDRERLGRLQAEKQRDAYATAYEAALQHIEKWS